MPGAKDPKRVQLVCPVVPAGEGVFAGRTAHVILWVELKHLASARAAFDAGADAKGDFESTGIWRRYFYLIATETPLENAESCNSSLTIASLAGIWNGTTALIVTPGFTWVASWSPLR